MKKACYVLSYKEPRYVRSLFIIQLLEKLPNVKLYRAINNSRGVFRYPQTLIKLLWLRITKRPDVYILGFRGLEIFWLVRILTIGKSLVYDEFLNPYLWLVEEHKKIPKHSLREKGLRAYVASTYRFSKLVLSDTDAHAEYSAKTFSLPKSKLLTLYVGTDENLFQPIDKQVVRNPKIFQVFFYGNFLPLHGLDIIVESANILKEYTDIKFVIVGGAKRKKSLKKFKENINRLGLKNVEHRPWIEFNDIPKLVTQSDLCLGGPFGGTPQAEKVITGKTYQFLSMGAPTLIGSIDEDSGLRDKVNCLIVPQGNPSALAEKIKWAYTNKDKLITIGKNGKLIYEKKFSQNSQSEKLERALIKLVE